MNKKVLIGGTLIAIAGFLILRKRLPHFSVEGIDHLNKKVRFIFDGNQATIGHGDLVDVPGRDKYVLIAQGDANGVGFSLFKEDVLVKPLKMVYYNQTTLPDRL